MRRRHILCDTAPLPLTWEGRHLLAARFPRIDGATDVDELPDLPRLLDYIPEDRLLGSSDFGARFAAGGYTLPALLKTLALSNDFSQVGVQNKSIQAADAAGSK